MTSATPLDRARAYVAGNEALACALGVSSSQSFAVAPLAQGEHNANFLLTAPDGNAFVLRINYTSQLGLAEQARYEFDALAALQSSGRTPRPLYVDETRERIDHGVLVESFVAGEWLNFEDAAQVREAARVLADVHSVPVSDDAPLLAPPDPLAEQLGNARALFQMYRESALAEARVVKAVEHMFARAEETIAHIPAPEPEELAHILNTEAVPSHFLIDAEGRGSMVDWEKPILGEVAQDLAYFLSPTTTIWDTDFIFDQPARRRFIGHYWEAVGDRFNRGTFDARFPAYVMSNALIGVTWSCNALVEYDDPARPLKNDKTRAKLPIYISDDFLGLLWRDCFSDL